MGYNVSDMAMSVVESATRTVIVCFAEQPPRSLQWATELQQGWAAAYPNAWNSQHRQPAGFHRR